MPKQILDSYLDLQPTHRSRGDGQNLDDCSLHHTVAQPLQRRLPSDRALQRRRLPPRDACRLEHHRQWVRGV